VCLGALGYIAPVHSGAFRPVSGSGEVAEWLKAPHSKCGILARVSGVRIPPSPPIAAPSLSVLVRFLIDLAPFFPQLFPSTSVAFRRNPAATHGKSHG